MVQKGKRNKNASLDNYRWGIWAYQEPALRNTVNFSFNGQLCVTAFRKVCYCWTMALWNLWNELKVQKTNVTAKLTLPLEHEWKEKGDAESFCFVLLLHCRILSFSMNVNLLPHCSHPCVTDPSLQSTDVLSHCAPHPGLTKFSTEEQTVVLCAEEIYLCHI